MAIKFISRIRKGNNKGTGFIYLPKIKTNLLVLGDRVRTGLSENIYFFSKIISHSHRLGVYVPKHIVTENDLLHKEVKIRIEKVDGFYAPVASGGRIYIPYDIVKSELLHHNDIISIKAIEDDELIQKEYVKIYVTERPERNKKEFICYVNKNLSGRTLVFQIEKLSSTLQNGRLNQSLTKLLQDTHYAFIDEDSAIIFKGNKVPAIINPNLKLSNLAFYLGAYFADGTRKGNYWAISASTFEQAKYYLKIHDLLIKDSKPEFIVSYTNIHKIRLDKIKEKLAKIWKDKTGIRISRFRIRKPEGNCFLKWNKYGTLIIREPRQILLDVYNTLVKLLIEEILSKKDKKLAMDFICGVMEGDGCASATKRGHMMIFTNKNDICTLENILKGAEIRFKTVRDSETKYVLRIGALEILRNFNLLKNKIFILYPKRRKTFFERLKTVGAIRFLIGNYEPSAWIKAWLKNTGFCDKNYKITNKGLKLSNDLIANINKSLVGA